MRFSERLEAAQIEMAKKRPSWRRSTSIFQYNSNSPNRIGSNRITFWRITTKSNQQPNRICHRCNQIESQPNRISPNRILTESNHNQIRSKPNHNRIGSKPNHKRTESQPNRITTESNHNRIHSANPDPNQIPNQIPNHKPNYKPNHTPSQTKSQTKSIH